jgi:hypothetical protein
MDKESLASRRSCADCSAAIARFLLPLAAGVGCLGSGGEVSKGMDASPFDGAADSAQVVDAGTEAATQDEIVADEANEVTNAFDAERDGTYSCPSQMSASGHASVAHSAGFSGTDAQYAALYNIACQKVNDCLGPCETAGGSTASCSSSSACVPQGLDGGLACLPPTYWQSVNGAFSESGTIGDAAHVILVAVPYEDALVLTNFGVSVPDDVTITGIQFRIRRATLASDAVDDVIQVLQNGAQVGANRAQGDAWPALPAGSSDLTVSPAQYGGPSDTWGAAWTPADIRSAGFGISIEPKYTGPSAGNERAYIDSVRVTVFYQAACD